MKKISPFILLLCLFISLYSQAQTTPISLEDIWRNGTFYPKGIADITPSETGDTYYILEDNIMVNKYSFKTGEKIETLARMSELKLPGSDTPIGFDDFSFSSDESKMLISGEKEKLYRYSKYSKYYVWDRAAKKLQIIATGEKCRDAVLSPDGKKVAYTRDNNLFVQDLGNGTINQVSQDGKLNEIINASSDWVYEEEFDLLKAFHWSKDSRFLAFYRFDESKVPEYCFSKYNALYPEPFQYKYPKAGEVNSRVSIFIYQVEKNSKVQLDLGKDTDQYIPNIMWTNQANTLCVYRMNRHQNKLELLLADALDGKTRCIYTEESKYYVDLNDFLHFSADGSSFYLCSEKNGYNHLYQYDLQGKLLRQITQGNWYIAKILKIDEVNRILYYTSTESAPYQRDVYRISLDGKEKKNLFPYPGWHDLIMSQSGTYGIHTFSDANTPKKFELVDLSKKKVNKTLENNELLKQKTQEFGFGKKVFFSFNTSENIPLNAWMIKPTNFDSTRKYPVLMYVYGGPGSQTVLNQYEPFDFVWFQMLAQKGYIIVSVDNRGTGFRSEEFKKCTYLQLGKLETRDQVEAAKYLGNLPYIDKSRIGIFGWSYGGYMSTLCMTNGADYFKAGIAVAPVTNWKYYDNIYTERFMRTPRENPTGYEENAPISQVKKLKGKFLLVHGSADDNVHLQNSMELVKALVNANKQFDMFIYPDKNHSIYGGMTRLNLYQKMTDFILNNL